MAIGRRSSLEKQLRTLWIVGTNAEAEDRTLLSRYAVSPGDAAEEAFRVLVERHSPMVLRVCRQVIGDRQDAEDAAQAVFLVLARKAGSLRFDRTVAPWLHGVARRVAAKARCRAVARKEAEIKTARVAASIRDGGGDGDRGPDALEWSTIHEEVDRLPEKYRAPVVLCYLQGETYEQAAMRIGCPVGTVRVRLSRARDRLRGRLSRRGFGPERMTAVGWTMPDPVALVTPGMAASAGTLSGGVAWVEATVRAARALSAGRAAMAGTVSASVLSFYEGLVRTMMIDGYRTAAAWLVAAGITVAGALALAATGRNGQSDGAAPTGQPTTAAAPKSFAPEPAIDFDSPAALRKQTERRVTAARQRLEVQRAFYRAGRITLNRFIDASQQLMLAESAASPTKDGRVAAARAHMDRIAEIAKLEQAELEKGRGTTADVAEALVAQENATCEYLEARQAPGSVEVEGLAKRVEGLEKQVELVIRGLERSRNVQSQRPGNEPPVDLDSSETLRKQTERRVVAARQRLDSQRGFHESGRITIDRHIEASRQLMLAEARAGSTKEAHLAAARSHWDRMAELQKREQAKLDEGKGTVADLAEAVVAHEIAAFDYIEARQGRATTEVDALRQRVETIEKRLGSIQKPLTLPGAGRQ